MIGSIKICLATVVTFTNIALKSVLMSICQKHKDNHDIPTIL